MSLNLALLLCQILKYFFLDVRCVQQTNCQKARLEKSKVRHYQHLTTDKLVYDFGLISCDELTNIKVNIEDKKLTPLDLTKKVHKKTLDKRCTGNIKKTRLYSGTSQLGRPVRRT